MAEEHSYRLFKALVREGKMHVIPTLLPGRLKQGLQAVLLYPFKKTLAWKAVGELKFKTFENYSKVRVDEERRIAGAKRQQKHNFTYPHN